MPRHQERSLILPKFHQSAIIIFYKFILLKTKIIFFVVIINKIMRIFRHMLISKSELKYVINLFLKEGINSKIVNIIDKIQNINNQLFMINCYVAIRIISSNSYFFINYVFMPPNENIVSLEREGDLNAFVAQNPSIQIAMQSVGLKSTDIPWGKLYAKKASKSLHGGACAGAWIVSETEALKGWGPLLYEIAVEESTQRDEAGLSSDRDIVSPSARSVWTQYGNRRDVIITQLDDPNNTLTTTEMDNCWQHDRKENGDSIDWINTSLSKSYAKNPHTIIKLENLGILLRNNRGIST